MADTGVTPASQPVDNSFNSEAFAKEVAALSEPETTTVPEKTIPADTVKTPEAKAQDGSPNTAKANTPVVTPIDPPEPPKPVQTIPKERFDEVNAKNARLEKKIETLTAAQKAERDRVSQLDADAKEEYEMNKKLGAVTRESLLEDQINELKSQQEELTAQKQQLESQLSEASKQQLEARIHQLTTHYDGKNGLPKFDIQELFEYGKNELGALPKDPLKLYQMKHAAAIYAATAKPTVPAKPVTGNSNPESAQLPAKKKDPSFKSQDFEDDIKAVIENWKE